jgi:hypothetical protein
MLGALQRMQAQMDGLAQQVGDGGRASHQAAVVARARHALALALA